MSLWWARKEQLDNHQIKLIEEVPLSENSLILGPPGIRENERSIETRTVCPNSRHAKCRSS